MIYQIFLENVRAKVQELLGGEYVTTIKQIQKPNGLVVDGLAIRKIGDACEAQIRLDRLYQAGSEIITDPYIKTVAEKIVRLYQKDRTSAWLQTITQAICDDFEKAKPHIMFKLINAETNRELLKTTPHIPYLDLAIVFFMEFLSNEKSSMVAIIKSDHMENWNVEVQDLWAAAQVNTVEWHKASIRLLSDMIDDMLQTPLDDAPDFQPLYIISNNNNIYGAACILYPNVLQEFADTMGTNLIVLPSSIHECLLLPYTGDLDAFTAKELNAMVTSINHTEVSLTDRLSNNVYLFKRSTGRLEIAS